MVEDFVGHTFFSPMISPMKYYGNMKDIGRLYSKDTRKRCGHTLYPSYLGTENVLYL